MIMFELLLKHSCKNVNGIINVNEPFAKIIYGYYWSRRIYAWARAKHFGESVCLSVCLSSREFTLRSSNLNTACSAATSLSPLMEKVYFYRNFVSREPPKV